MLQFGTLLLKQLQRQQSKAEFCDTVLQSQGVSVPVHSCVLSAFSPWLCGALSTVPAPMVGQRRLIELQAVEASTLLSLVRLLYSGQLQGNAEEVLSVADSLGIKLPNQHMEDRSGNKASIRKERNSLEQEERMKTSTDDDGEGGARNSSTQTVFGEWTEERETQTDKECLELQQSFQTLHLPCQLPCSTDQEHGTLTDATLMLQTVQSLPGQTPSACNLLMMAPETEVHQTVSDSTCVSQDYLYPPYPSFHQSLTPATPLSPTSYNSYLEIGMSSDAGTSTVEGFEQFEENISGFIKFFLDSAQSPRSEVQQGQGRGRGCSKTSETREKVVVRAPRARRGRGGQRKGPVERSGWLARLAWRGQGGGRVGRKLDTRSVEGNPVRKYRRRQVQEKLLEAGKGRGRQRCKSKRGALVGSKGQDDEPRTHLQRDHPHVRPFPSVSCSSYAESLTYQNTLGSLDSSLQHTEPLPPGPQTVPGLLTDWLLSDAVVGLDSPPAIPEEFQTNQQGFVIASGIPHALKTSTHSIERFIDQQVPQQQSDREMNDVLDQFLRTFQQQVCDEVLDVGQVIQDPNLHLLGNTPNTHTHWHKSNFQQTVCQVKPRVRVTQRCVKHLDETPHRLFKRCKANKHNLQLCSLRPKPRRTKQNFEKLEIYRITRRQSRKRKLEAAFVGHRIQPKRKCKLTRSYRTSENKIERVSHIFGRRRRVCRTKHKHGVAKRSSKLGIALDDLSHGEENNRSMAKTTSLKNLINEAYVEDASSAFEKMKHFLKSRMDKKEEYERNRTVEGYKTVCGTEVGVEETVAISLGGAGGERGSRQDSEGNENTGRNRVATKEHDPPSQLANAESQNLHHCHQARDEATIEKCDVTTEPSETTQSASDVPQIEEGSVENEDEDEEVDVVEVLSPYSNMETMQASVVVGAELSLEEEEEEEENMEIDVTGEDTV